MRPPLPRASRAALLLLLLGVAFLQAGQARADAQSSAQQEKTDRLVDRAALAEMQKAVQSIEKQLKRCRELKLGAEREEQLLFKLGDLRYQRAEIEFRVGMHQRADNRYRKSLLDTIATLTELARRFPRTEEMPRLLWTRARAFSDLDRNKEAEADYLRLTAEFKEFEQIDSARMALGRIRMERNDYNKAIEALTPIRSKPESSFYPHALQQIAWCHYNLDQTDAAIRAALDAIEQLRKSPAGSVDASLVDQLTQDIATFYGDAMERDPARFKVAGAWELLTRIHPKPGTGGTDSFSPAAIRMGKLLRSKALGADLKGWSVLLWKNFPTLECTLTVDHLLREFADNNKDWDTVLEPLKPGPFAPEAWESHRKLYTAVQNRIQDLLKKNPDAPAEKTLPWLEKLGRAYEAFLAVTPQGDPRRLQAELQLLKVEFAVLDQKKLRRKFAVSRRSKPAAAPSPIAAYLPVLARLERLKAEIPSDQLAPLALEKARMLYEQGRVDESLKGFGSVLDDHGGTPDARSALAALLDQAIADEDRTALDSLLERRSAFKKDPQAQALLDKATLQRDILVLKSPASPSEKDSVLDRFLGRIQSGEALPADLSDYVITEKAALLRSSSGPEQVPAILELLSRLSHPEKQESLVLLLAYGQGKAGIWMGRKGFCAEKSEALEFCTQIKAMASLEVAPARSEVPGMVKALLRSSAGAGNSRTLVAMRLLIHARSIGQKDLGFKDRGVVLRTIARGWKDLHPVLQWQLLPRWLKHSSEILMLNTASLRESSPLRTTEAHLVHRMDLVKSFENLAKDLQKMGIFETALAALEAQARVLADFAADLKPLPVLVPQLNEGVMAQAEGLKKILAEQNAALQKAISPAESRLGTDSRPAAALEYQVWAFANPEKDPAKRNAWVARILWAQGARHAASQLLASPST